METAQTELFDPQHPAPPLMTGPDPATYRTDPARLRHEAIHRAVEAALRHIVEARPEYPKLTVHSAAIVALACGTFPQSAPLTYDQVVMRLASACSRNLREIIDNLMVDAANAVLEGCNSGAAYHSAEATRGVCEMFGIDYDAICARVDGEGQV